MFTENRSSVAALNKLSFQYISTFLYQHVLHFVGIYGRVFLCKDCLYFYTWPSIKAYLRLSKLFIYTHWYRYWEILNNRGTFFMISEKKYESEYFSRRKTWKLTTASFINCLTFSTLRTNTDNTLPYKTLVLAKSQLSRLQYSAFKDTWTISSKMQLNISLNKHNFIKAK